MATTKQGATKRAAGTGKSGAGAVKKAAVKVPTGGKKAVKAAVGVKKAPVKSPTGGKKAVKGEGAVKKAAVRAPGRGKKAASLAKGKDPKGGLTAEGRRYFKEKEGLNLRPGVQGKADTPEKMVRKGSFLRRHFANPPGPVKDEKGEPTRQALQAAAWGEPVPQNEADERKLAEKGSELLEQYHAVKDGKTAAGKKSASAKKKS